MYMYVYTYPHRCTPTYIIYTHILVCVIRADICTCVPIHIYTHTVTSVTYAEIHVYVCTHMYTSTLWYMHIYTRMFWYWYTDRHRCTHIHADMYNPHTIYTYVLMNTHVHTYTHRWIMQTRIPLCIIYVIHTYLHTHIHVLVYFVHTDRHAQAQSHWCISYPCTHTYISE